MGAGLIRGLAFGGGWPDKRVAISGAGLIRGWPLVVAGLIRGWPLVGVAL